jgi:serine/threonine protein kinase
VTEQSRDAGAGDRVPGEPERPRKRSDSEDGGVEEFGPYMVYELLGRGGMATVHRAEKRGVGIRRPIALKRLLPHVAEEPELVQLFVDEARLASHLHHANVAQTYELGKVGDTFFIAMEYASGPTLSQIVRQCQKAAGEIPIAITVNILAQVCDALDYAHNLCDESGQPLRIVHRDVSPGNIVVTNTGVVKLIDFGIAKATISSVKTQAGFIKGKFGYIAPEYMTGQIDARVDLFAMGVVAHEMLAGRRLFEGRDDFETLDNIRQLAIRPPSVWNANVTPDIDDIVMMALARNPAKRWQTAHAMQIALTSVMRDLGVVVGGPQIVEWVEWAFSQVPREPDRHDHAMKKSPGVRDTDEVAQLPSVPESSISIQFGPFSQLRQPGASHVVAASAPSFAAAHDTAVADGVAAHPPVRAGSAPLGAAHDPAADPLAPLDGLEALDELAPLDGLEPLDELAPLDGLEPLDGIAALDELGGTGRLETRRDLGASDETTVLGGPAAPDDLSPIDSLAEPPAAPRPLGAPDRLAADDLAGSDPLATSYEPAAPEQGGEVGEPAELAAPTGPYPFVPPPVGAEYNEAVPLDRVLIALNDTPPPVIEPRTAALPLPLPGLPRRSSSQDVAAHAPRTPRAFDSAPPPVTPPTWLPNPASPPGPVGAPRRGRDRDGAEPTSLYRVLPSTDDDARDRDGRALPQGRLFGEPEIAPLPVAQAAFPPRPAPPSQPAPLPAPIAQAAAVTPRAEPARRRSVLWLILLMVALGVAAMAAAYFWPADL